MKKDIIRNLILTITTSIPVTLLAVFIGNFSGWWVFETWHEILYLFLAINITIIASDIKSYITLKKKDKKNNK